MMRTILAHCLPRFVAFWVSCLRYKRIGDVVDRPGLIAFWHGDQLALLGQRPAGPLVAPISLSEDGTLQAEVMSRFGIEAVRGSSHRGAVSVVRGLLRAIRNGAVCLVAVDGSRGPRREAKRGAVYLAQRTRQPIWVAGVAVARGHRLKNTWDHFLLPWLGTKTVVSIEGPWEPPPGVDPQALIPELESRLATAQNNAEAELKTNSL